MITGIRKLHLLYIGNEPMLNKASAELLKGAGYKVRSSTSGHAVEVLREGKFAAVVLCATLSTLEAERIVQAISEFQPRTPIISVHLGLLGDAPNPNSAIVVDALNGPQAFITAVNQVTQSQSPPISKAV